MSFKQKTDNLPNLPPATNQEDEAAGRKQEDSQEPIEKREIFNLPGSKASKKKKMNTYQESRVRKQSIPAECLAVTSSLHTGTGSSWESLKSSSSWGPEGAVQSPVGRKRRGSGGNFPNNIILSGPIKISTSSLHETFCQTSAAYICTEPGAPNSNTGGGMTTVLQDRIERTNGKTTNSSKLHHWTTSTLTDDAIPRGHCNTTSNPAEQSGAQMSLKRSMDE